MKQNKSKKKNRSVFLIVVLFFTGVMILLYPTISNWQNDKQQSQSIEKYLEAVAQMEEKEYEILWEDAYEYNQRLLTKTNRYYLTEAEYQEYMSLINISGNGVMAYLEIPTIDLKIPIYHGTDENVLQRAVGHIAGSSLPIGGANTHCIIAGHRGLPSARLFTDLDKLQEGDLFFIRVLNKILTYEVDQILITEPGDISAMKIMEESDYCTLMTCTPYGVNTHRLLIRGCRV